LLFSVVSASFCATQWHLAFGVRSSHGQYKTRVSASPVQPLFVAEVNATAGPWILWSASFCAVRHPLVRVVDSVALHPEGVECLPDPLAVVTGDFLFTSKVESRIFTLFGRSLRDLVPGQAIAGKVNPPLKGRSRFSIMWKTCLSRGYVSFHLSLPSSFASLAVAVTYESIFPRLVTFSPRLGWNVGRLGSLGPQRDHI
jgi:hypothetical protein